MENEEKMLTFEQVLDVLKVSRSTVNNWIKKGKLHPVKKNPILEKSPLLFKASEIEQLQSGGVD